jgi:DeoR family fructose operon transcriptional repressor
MKNNSSERQSRILQLVEQQGACSYHLIAKVLNTSNMTVRRDMEKLAEKGLVIKTLGGVQKANAPEEYYETSLLSRLQTNKGEKMAIARKALEKIDKGDCVFLDGSSTCIELSKLIGRERDGVTIITNSVAIYGEIARCQTNNVLICLGGNHDSVSYCMVGNDTEEQAKKYFVDKAFMSTKGFMPDEGTFESSVAAFKIKQVVAGRCKELILLVDHSKFGERALSKVLDISQINKVITDNYTDQEHIMMLQKKAINVELAIMDDLVFSK